MSTTIYKYEVQPNIFTLMLPEGAVCLSVQTQFNKPQMWALVEPTAPKKPRLFRSVGTGQTLEDDGNVMNFIGTFQLQDGALVLHLFEIVGEESL